MLRDFINRLRKPKKNCVQPIEFISTNTVRFTMATLQRLEDLHNRGAWMREQQEAAAAECCELLNCDPDGGEVDTDYATEIIYMGTPIGAALDSIIQYREMRDNQCR